MTVYIDDARIYSKGRYWYHLVGTNRDELVNFALNMGLQKSYMHNGNHFDLTEAKRTQAIRMGAKPITAKLAVSIIKLYKLSHK